MRNRKARALAPALGAMLALGAIAATGASAQVDGQEDHFTTSSDNDKAVITAEDTEGTGIFDVHGSNNADVTCKHATYTGTVEDGATELSLVPTYTECSLAGQGATVTVDECEYTLYGETTEHERHPTTGTGLNEVHAPIRVHCAEDGKITIKGPACEITILAHEQNKLHGVTYDNVVGHYEGKDAVEINTTIDGITNTAVGFVCELLEIPEYSTAGFLTAEIIATGYEDIGGSLGTYEDEAEEHGDLVDIGVLSTPVE